jgi:hypothetical protein
MAIAQAVYTATATSTGGRTGTTQSSDGRIKLQLSTPKELGGDDGPGTNPEQLFAAGYSACFIGAMKAVAGARRSLPAEVSITADVAIGPMAARQAPSASRWRWPGQHAGHGPRRGRDAGGRRARGLPLLERHARQRRRVADGGLIEGRYGRRSCKLRARQTVRE